MNVTLTNCKLDVEYIEDYESMEEAISDHNQPSSIFKTAILPDIGDPVAIYTAPDKEYNHIHLTDDF